MTGGIRLSMMIHQERTMPLRFPVRNKGYQCLWSYKLAIRDSDSRQPRTCHLSHNCHRAVSLLVKTQKNTLQIHIPPLSLWTSQNHAKCQALRHARSSMHELAQTSYNKRTSPLDKSLHLSHKLSHFDTSMTEGTELGEPYTLPWQCRQKDANFADGIQKVTRPCSSFKILSMHHVKFWHR